MAGCLYLCKAGFIRLCMHGHVFACMDGDCLFMDDNTLIVPGFPPWRFYSALRLTCFWLQLVGFWLQLLLLRGHFILVSFCSFCFVLGWEPYMLWFLS